MARDQLMGEQRLIFNTYAFISVAGPFVKNVINSQFRILKINRITDLSLSVANRKHPLLKW